MKTPKTPELIQHMLDSLETPIKDLTDWEMNFLDSIARQFDEKKTLSDKQFEILERIYAAKTA